MTLATVVIVGHNILNRIKPSLLPSKTDGNPTADEGAPALPEGLIHNLDRGNSETEGN